MITLNNVHDYSEKSMAKYVTDFRMNKDSKESELVSDGKVNMEKKFFRLPSAIRDRFQYKSRVYSHPGYCFIPLTINFVAERFRKHLKIDLKEIQMVDLIEKLRKVGCNRVLDFYFNGIKQNPRNITIIFDYDKIILVLKDYPMKIDIVIRNNIRDYSSNTSNIINIPAEQKLEYNEAYKLAFCNGLKTTNYTTDLKDDGSIDVIFQNSHNDCEFILLPHYIRHIIVQDTNWVDIFPNSKLTIDMDNLLAYDNGAFLTLTESDFVRKGNSLFKFTANIIGKEILLFHKENKDDLISSYNIIEWYRDNVSANVAKELNSNSAPSLLTNFNNFTEDVSSTIAFDSNKDSYAFNRDIIKKFISYNSENFKDYITKYLQKRNNFSDTFYIDTEKYGYTNFIRNDTSDVPSKTKFEKFPFPMVLFTIDNPEYKPLQVYLDGIALFRHMRIYNSMGRSYIYIRLNKFIKNSIVEIERYNLDNDQISKDVMIGDDGKYSMHNTKYYSKELISVFKIEGDTYIPVEFSYDDINMTMDIGLNKRGLYRIVVNNAIVRQEYVINSRKLQILQFNLQDLKFTKYDNSYYRVYKNGRLIPRKFYTIEFPNSTNNKEFPFIHINCKCFMSEVITVEYTPYKMREVYSEDIIDEFGRIKIDPLTLEYPLGLKIDSIYLNGRKLHNENIIQKSSSGMELVNIISRKNFYILLKEDYDNYTNFPEFTDLFHKGNREFDNYIKDTMVGSRINDLESNVLDKDYNVMRDLYWDLYNEYLKYAIVNFGGKLPKYIAIKYSDLIDENNMILIDCEEEMNHWMPLDASKTIDEKMQEIAIIYEKMLDRINNMENIVPYELSEYEIEKLKSAGLITNNIIAIDLSN